MKELWTEKYRPKTLDGYVFKDASLREKIENWVKEGSIPHLLFKGKAGVGKTTMAKILIEQLGVQDSDVLLVNGSKEGRKIEWVDKLIMFCSTMAFGDFKIVLIDEADYMNPQSVQPALRNLMEEYSGSVRFIMTCNYPNRILPAIQSRCEIIPIEKTDIDEFTARAATILLNENVDFDLESLDKFVKQSYPDLRKCIINLESNSMTGKLIFPELDDATSDYKLEMVELFRAGKISEARKLICSQALPEEIEEVYRWLYDNIEIFGDELKQDKAILIIKQGLVDHTLVIDPEINLSATLIKLAHLSDS